MPAHVKDLGLDPRLVARLEAVGYGELWPSQEGAAPVVVAGKSVVLAVPTASGKSLIAYLALLSRALKGSKGLYLVPLRALASEKFEDLRELAKGLGLRVAVSTGDLDDAEPRLGDFDVIVTTNEKADALLRHRAHWLAKIGCIVADEVHLLNEPGRGPTMEVLLARFKQLNPNVQVVALSATVANSREIAAWLNAEHFQTEWRPVTLSEGVHYGRAVKFTDNRILEVASDLDDPSLALAEDSVKSGGQCLVFVNTRKSTEALAEKLASKSVKPHLKKETLVALKDAVASIRAGEDVTTVEARLAKCILGGAAFHHAGLRNVHRALVERLFKEGHLKALAATPTLAAGINLPARRVVVRDLWRYDAGEGGNAPISVMEYKQMAGRAGRPRYDKVGEAVTLAKTQDQAAQILLNYVLADPEKVYSKLGTEGALRAHVLASVASGFVDDEKSLNDFIKATFFAHQNDLWSIQAQVTGVIDFLLENDLLTQAGDKFRATRFGKRVSELYIDPLSAVKLREALARAADEGRELSDVSFLHAVSATPDVRPLFVRRSDAWLEGEALEREDELLLKPPSGLEYEWFLGELKTACLLHDWIEEATEDEITKKYQIYPGDLHTKVDAAEWLLGAVEEMARTFVAEAKDAVEAAKKALDRGAMGSALTVRDPDESHERSRFVAGGDRDAAAARAADALAVAARWLGPTEEPEKAAPTFEARGSAGSDFVTYSVKSSKPEPVVRAKKGTAAAGAARDAFEDARRELARLESRMARYRDNAKLTREIGVRVREGARAELLPLLKFRGIGRYRARQLWKVGYKSEKDLRAASVIDLSRVPGIGPALAGSLKKQMGQDDGGAAPPAPDEAAPASGQTMLGDF